MGGIVQECAGTCGVCLRNSRVVRKRSSFVGEGPADSARRGMEAQRRAIKTDNKRHLI